jgi:hypothetical protein
MKILKYFEFITRNMNPKYIPKNRYTEKDNFPTRNLTNKSKMVIITQQNSEKVELNEKVKNIPKYSQFFAPFTYKTSVNGNGNYTLVEHQSLVPFDEFFSNIPKNQLSNFIESSFSHLIEATSILNESGIDCWTAKIGFNYQNQPILFDFERNTGENECFSLYLSNIYMILLSKYEAVLPLNFPKKLIYYMRTI